MNGQSAPRRRRLTLMDLTVMVAAAALALATFRFGVTRVFPGWLDYSRWPGWIARPSPRVVLYMLSDATAPIIPLAGAWTGSLLVLRMRPPRPSWRRVWRQPGMVACLAALLAMLWVGLAAGVMLGSPALFPSWRFDGLWFVQNLCVGHVFPLVGLAVAATWSQLLLSRRWTRPADWLDRAGRVVGILWMVIGLAWTLRSYEPLIR
jgi:hypothetical protein